MLSKVRGVKNFLRKRVLYVATLDITIWSFLIPHIKVLQEEGFEVEVACGGGRFIKEIEKENIKVYYIPFTRRFYDYSNINAFFKILKILRENRYTVLHTHTPIASFICRIAARIVKVPIVIYTIHGFHFHEYGGRLSNAFYYILERLAGRFTNIFITINTDDYKMAKKMFPNKKVFYIKGIGIDTRRFMPENVDYETLINLRYEFGIKDNEKVIGMIAEMIPRKRHIDLLKSGNLILKRRDDINFLIVGDGKLMEYHRKVAKRLGIDKRCIFTGFRRDILELLSLMDIFVLPSIREGLPVSIMEAMSMKKPIVASNIRGNRELVIDGITGRLVPARNPQAIADAVLEIIEDSKKAKQMGEEARRKIEREFNEEIITKQISKVFAEVFKLGGGNFKGV